MIIQKNLRKKYYGHLLPAEKSIGQLHQCKIDTAIFDDETVYSLTFPKSFVDFIVKATEKKEEENKQFKLTFNWRTLCRQFMDQHTHIIFVNTDSYKLFQNQLSSEPFLLTKFNIQVSKLQTTFKKWFASEFQLDWTYDQWDDFSWEEITFKELLNSSLKYNVIPNWFLYEFASKPMHLEGINQNKPLHFYYNKKYESGKMKVSCVSETVYFDTRIKGESEKKKMNDWFTNFSDKKSFPLPGAYEIQCTLCTKPFEKGEFLNVTISLKRGVYYPLQEALGYNDTLTLLIYNEDKHYHSNVKNFVEVKLETKNKEIVPSQKTDQNILDHLVSHGFDFEEFVKNPTTYINDNGKIKVFPVFNVQLNGKNMFLEQGIGLHERNSLFLTFCEFFGLTPEKPLIGKNISMNRDEQPFILKEDILPIEIWDNKEKVIWNAFPENIGLLWGPKKTEIFELNAQDEKSEQIILNPPSERPKPEKKSSKSKKETKSYYEFKTFICKNEQVLQFSVKTLQAHLNENKKKKKKEQSKTHKAYMFIVPFHKEDVHLLTILYSEQINQFYVQWKDIQHLNSELNILTIPSAKAGTSKKEADEKKRLNEIKQTLVKHPVNELTMSIVGIHPFHKFNSLADPKTVLRKGFLQKNRITQFINYKDENFDYTHVICSSFQDILKDKGILPIKFYRNLFSKENHKNEVWIGVNSLTLKKEKGNCRLLIACKIEALHEPEFCFVHERIWYPIDQFYERLADDKYKKQLLSTIKLPPDESSSFKKKEQNYDIWEKYMTDFVNDLLSENDTPKEFYITIDVNTRQMLLKGMQNEKLPLTKKPFLDMENIHYARYNDTTEVPNIDLLERVKDDYIVNRPSGVYHDEEKKHFYLLGAKLDTTMKTKSTKNKEENGSEAIMRQVGRELIVLGEPNTDKRFEIAEKHQKMRNASITFDKELSDVMTIHYTNALSKYFEAMGYK